MVKLHIKRGDESQFLFETTCQVQLSELVPEVVKIYNGRLKIERLFHGEEHCMNNLMKNRRNYSLSM